jgi:HD-like signal output (HDOD) protein
MMSSLDSFFGSVHLPSMSEVSHALIKTLHNDQVTHPEVRNILARDAALSARLLRLANSAQFGLPRGVATLDDAIAMVGLAQVRALALAACLNDAFPKLGALDRRTFWKSSVACAAYAQWLAGKLGIDAQTAWLCGIMLRLGAVVHLASLMADQITLGTKEAIQWPEAVVQSLGLEPASMQADRPDAKDLMELGVS